MPPRECQNTKFDIKTEELAVALPSQELENE